MCPPLMIGITWETPIFCNPQRNGRRKHVKPAAPVETMLHTLSAVLHVSIAGQVPGGCGIWLHLDGSQWQYL